MHFAALFAATLLGLARGQDEAPGQTPTGPEQRVHIVTVTRNEQNRTGNFFSPENIRAQPGDMVQFQFRGGNHTVTQATLDKPCVPMENGIFSGFQDVAPNSRIKTFDVRINDTKPVWFYCSQGKHCQNGMVGAVNAAADKMEQFKEAAKKAQGSSVTDSPSSPSSAVGAANSQYVLQPVVMLLALGAALMLL